MIQVPLYASSLVTMQKTYAMLTYTMLTSFRHGGLMHEQVSPQLVGQLLLAALAVPAVGIATLKLVLGDLFNAELHRCVVSLGVAHSCQQTAAVLALQHDNKQTSCA